MLYYRIEASILNIEELDPKGKENVFAMSVKERSHIFYQKHKQRIYLFVSYIRKNCLVLGGIARDKNILHDVLDTFWDFLDLKIENVSFREVIFKDIFVLLSSSERNDYVGDKYNLLELFELDEIEYFESRIGKMSEHIINLEKSKQELMEMTEEILCEETFFSEIDRIFKGTKNKNVHGHPVHYFIKTDDKDIKEKMIDILLSALYKNERISSRRYCDAYYSDSENLSLTNMNSIYKSNFGGTMVVSFNSDIYEDENNFGRTGLDVIQGLCNTMLRYQENVLTVFCLPRNSEKTKALFYENLQSCSFIELSEEIIYGIKVKEYLKKQAKSHDITPDKNLYKNIKDLGKGYLAADLNKEFNSWFSKALKTRVYPQYKKIECVSKETALYKPKGSAFQELQEMIGLKNAKDVIGQAIDFYKAQKLFKEKGMDPESVSMHMVFTGNPGSAKTTVARLFASIMKENGILSIGDLYEVGRADLVGKYVGWTARIVREKFSAAKGSVLFIDEAYSLSDGQYNTFGDEAINTIVQEMENNREDIIVIFAGYPEQMQDFLNRNPGLRSRIAFNVNFEDYNPKELYEIAKLIAKKKGLVFSPGTEEKIMPVFEYGVKTSDFGNGRFARNIIEKARLKQAQRLIKMDIPNVSSEEIEALIPEDFEISEIHTPSINKIGF